MEKSSRILALREVMKQKNIDAFIVFSADPHMSEYLPLEWKEREWISGFTGSAGFVVVLKDKAGLWTDGRYFTQAPKELKGSGIDLFKDGVEGTPNYIDWIIQETHKDAKVAVNAMVTSHINWSELETKLQLNDRVLVNEPLLNETWTNRKESDKNEIFLHPLTLAGETTLSKIEKIRKLMSKKRATSHVISSLDDVAWTLNLRGSDVKCNPVFLGYLYITLDNAVLFTDESRLTIEAKEHLKQSKVDILKYNDFYAFLEGVKGEKVLVAPNTNQAVFNAIKNSSVVVGAAPGHLLKAVKNTTELEGFRKVMVRDGVAMVNFLYWLSHNAGKENLNEFKIGEQLLNFRKEQENFVGPSFGSIVGYLGNGAIIHYSAPKENSATVENVGSILVDSGGQYLEGTTDITRTFPLGEVTQEFIDDSTRVLKGLIRVSLLKFPKGTCGVHLDSWARMALWQEGKDYNHGTGHGVGSFMNVHEGPQSIRKDLNPTVLQEGMVLSNEPGYYVEDQYGIRHENLIAVKEWEKTEWNTFYEFETLTICPFFTSTINTNLLDAGEINWLNEYHQMCKEKLSPFLKGEVKAWFLDLVQPI